MPLNHVTTLIEAYLDDQLPLAERQMIEAHLAVCPICTNQLFIARQVTAELKPTLDLMLGHPVPPLTLRYRVQQALQNQTAPRFGFSWAIPGRVINAVGTAAVIGLLAFGAFTVIRGPIPGANVLPQISSLRLASDGDSGTITSPTVTPTQITNPSMVQEAKGGSLGDTLPRLNPTPTPVVQVNPQSTLATESSQTGINQAASLVGSPQASLSSSPAGTIAFSYLNLAVYPPVYQIHLISPDGNNHRLFPLDGVSEPALRSTTGSYQLAYRAWGQPTSPRSLLSSKLDGERPYRIGGFWEDAQPDWSPTEDRIIFASQRENDRRWRLYTIWGDGQAEVNLRREGKSPTFAPDGFRFAFESCDETGNRCGLWLGDLENSEYGSKPFLLDPLAQAPDWSPTGEEIAYMANPGGNWDLYLVNSNGRNVRRLTDDPSVDGLPAWSPDGEWLAFLSNRDNGWGIWLLHLDSSETRRIFSFDGDVFTPSDGPLYGQRNWWDEQISWSN
jgi:hypothetical protein